MSHVERGDSGLLDDAAQVVAQPQPQLRVKVAERLIEQEQLGLVDEAARERHALHLAAGERYHRTFGKFRKPDQLQHVTSFALDFDARLAAMAERIGDVLSDRHVRPDRVGLEHHPDVAQARRHLDAVERRRHQSPADADAPGGGMLEARDAA